MQLRDPLSFSNILALLRHYSLYIHTVYKPCLDPTLLSCKVGTWRQGLYCTCSYLFKGQRLFLFPMKCDHKIFLFFQRVLMQITQELCKRPGLNKAGFNMPTIYIPTLTGKVGYAMLYVVIVSIGQKHEGIFTSTCIS